MLNASIIWTILEVLSHTFFHYWNFVQKANFSRIAGNSNASSMMSWVEGICKQSLLMLREKCARTNYHAYLDFWRLVSPTRIVPPSLEPPVQANLSSSNAQLFPHLWWHFSIHTAASSILLQETPKMHLLQYPTNSHQESARSYWIPAQASAASHPLGGWQPVLACYRLLSRNPMPSERWRKVPGGDWLWTGGPLRRWQKGAGVTKRRWRLREVTRKAVAVSPSSDPWKSKKDVQPLKIHPAEWTKNLQLH